MLYYTTRRICEQPFFAVFLILLQFIPPPKPPPPKEDGGILAVFVKKILTKNEHKVKKLVHLQIQFAALFSFSLF
jgi:hypothetical protein